MSPTRDLRQTEDSRLEVISRDESLALISQVSVGRIAVALPHRSPLVVPVNYVLLGEAVLFRSEPGSSSTRCAAFPSASRSTTSTASTAPGGAC